MEFLGHLHVEGVELVRAVESDGGDVVFAIQQEGLVGHRVLRSDSEDSGVGERL